jgi:hypothetical protein
MIRRGTRVGRVPRGWEHFVSDGDGGMHVYLFSSFPAKYQRAFIWMPRMYFLYSFSHLNVSNHTFRVDFQIVPFNAEPPRFLAKPAWMAEAPLEASPH